MSIQVKTLYTNSKVPVSNNNGSYDVYSIEDKIISPNETVSINTGLSIYIPLGYYGIIQSIDSLMSNCIEAKDVATIHSDVNNKTPCEFSVYLRNFGLSNYKLSVGDVICKLVVINIHILPIKKVDLIEYDNVDTLINHDNKTESDNISVWFKKQYISLPNEVSTKYFTKYVIDKLKIYRTSKEYLMGVDKNSIEANYVWKILSRSIKKKITSDYINNINVPTQKVLVINDNNDDDVDDIDDIGDLDELNIDIDNDNDINDILSKIDDEDDDIL